MFKLIGKVEFRGDKMFYPYIAEMNEILAYSDVFIEPFEFDVEIKNINPYKALSIISELLAVRNMTFLVNAEIPLIGKIEVDVPYQMFLKKEFGDIVLSSSTEMFSDYRLMKNRHIIALQPMLILAKHIILCADEGMDTEENFTVSKDDYKTVIKLALKVAEKISERDSEKFDVSNFLYGTYHINNDHNVANEFARSYYILEKIGKKSEDFPEDIRAEYKDYWTAFKERYGYSMTEFLYSLFWELRKYYARDYYLTYSSSWEDIGAIYKESAMRLIAPMVIRNQAGTLAEYKEWCESSIDEMWDFKGFLEKPFIKTPAGKTLSLSELTLKNSFFENLFWNIRNCFPRTESRIMSFYGRLFEMYIQDQIEAIANGQKKYLYIREFRYGKGGGNKSSDAYLRIDNKLLAIEAKGFSVLFDCIVNQNVNSNLDKLFIKPVLQADRAFDDNKSIEDFNSVTDLYVLSVTMDSINAVPDYYEHCKNDIEKRKRSTCLKKFYNINIEELEMLLFMVEKQYDIFELLDQYFAEKYMMPLSNYIKSKCPEVIKMTSFLSGVYEEASIKMKEAYGIV